MVKFSKELKAQLIPEWKEAFVNYWQLKKHVKKIKILRRRRSHPKPDDGAFGRSILDPVRTLTHKISHRLRSSDDTSASVLQKSGGGFGEGEETCDEEEGGGWESEEAGLLSEEEEIGKFMERLGEELDKVNEFYEMKEGEFVERGESLNRQLTILLDLKSLVADRRGRCKDGSSRSTVSTRSALSSARNSDVSGELSDASDAAETRAEEAAATSERSGVSFVGGGGGWAAKLKAKKAKSKTSIRVDISSGDSNASNPVKTISAAMAVLWEDLVNNPRKDNAGNHINRKKIQYAEKMIRAAYVEFYRGLNLLKHYSALNMMAFTKILKKFDKVADRQESGVYLRKVKGKHFCSSDKVVRQIDEVESMFTHHFADKDRKKAMKFLRPHHRSDSHIVSFLVGLFTGSFATLFVVYAILAHLSGMFSDTEANYMEVVYPVFSMFALLSLHLFMYGCNLVMWKSTRINYIFIFDFQSRTALKHRDAFLLCTTSMTAVVAALVLHLLLKSAGFPPSQVDAVPACLLLIFIGLLICPLNVFYRPTRYSFLRVIRNILCSPFYKVLMVDFFMADQLTSQIPLLRHLETTTCYFLAGSFRTHHYEACKSGKMYRQLAYIISFSPYYWRAMQCARRWFDESDPAHLANLGKYASAMIAAGARLTYAQRPDSTLWMVIVLVTSIAATMYQLYWDFVRDWGFLNPSSKNPWLRDDLVLKNKYIYYVSIGVNVVLRVAWLESVLRFRVGALEARMLDFFLASLEVVRRGHWNFYRLEHEHLNNVGKFRAEKTVPLPFREGDSDD